MAWGNRSEKQPNGTGWGRKMCEHPTTETRTCIIKGQTQSIRLCRVCGAVVG